MKLSGQCLCGALQYQLESRSGHIYQCHCSICRRATGSSANANIVVKSEHFHWQAEPAELKYYRRASGWISAFCSTCGAKAPIHDSLRNIVYVPAGGLNEDQGLAITKHIYVGSKAEWDCIGGDAPQLALLDS